MAFYTKLEKMIALAKEMDRKSRYDLADNIDKTLNDIIILGSSKLVTQSEKKGCGCSSPLPKRITADAKSYDYMEDPQIVDILRDIGNKRDIEESELYHQMFGDFNIGEHPMQKAEQIKVLKLRRDMLEEIYIDYQMNGVPKGQEKNFELASKEINEIDKEINEIAKSMK